MTKSFTSLCLLGAALLGANARASFDLGNDVTLFPTATAGLQYNDNIFLSNKNAKSDSILDLAPGILLQFGAGAANKGQLSYSEDFQFYSSQSGLNTGLAKVDFLSRFDDGASKINVDAWFHQANQATRDVRSNGFLVRRDLIHGALVGENSISAKTSASLGIIYDDTDYKRTGYTDWQWFEVPFKYYYKIEPKLDLSGGFTYRDNQLGKGGIDSTEYFYNVGARGEIAPKLTGEVSIGLNQRKLKVGGTQNSLGIDSNFTYAATQKTSVSFGASNDFGYGATGTAYKNFGLNGGVTSDVSSDFKVGAQVSYSRYAYTGTQRDDFYTGQLSGTYLVNAYVTLTGTYAYAKDSSNLAGTSFTNNIFSISAAFRY